MNPSIHKPSSHSPSGKDHFGFKNFQLEDYARGALHDGLVLGHDTGGGKSLALFTWPALKVGFEGMGESSPSTSDPSPIFYPQPSGLKPLAPVLLVVPGDLHHKTIAEDAALMKAKVTVLDSQETFLRLSTVNGRNGKRELTPGYYLTSYTQLTGNGVTPFPEYDPGNVVGMMQILGLTDSDAGEFFDERETLFERHYKRLSAMPTMTRQELTAALNAACQEYPNNEGMKAELQHSFDILEPFHCDVYNPGFSDLPPAKKAIVRSQMTLAMYTQYAASIGIGKWYGQSAGLQRTEGRIGAANEFVEFAGADHTRYLAQKSADGSWSSYKCYLDAPYTEENIQALETYADKDAAVNAVEQLARKSHNGQSGSGGQSGTNGQSGTDFKIKCVYSPSLADLCQDAFAACAIDEGVKMKGEDTVVGTGVRQINAKYKLVLTATPIKNRLPDVFRLAWWATGARPKAHARFPYPDETAAREQFATTFLISERNLTKERNNGQAGKARRFKKLTPQVCNVHRLWKMFAPIILRRRKADFGEDIVTKTRHVVRAPMGKEQAAVYAFHLQAKYLDKNGGPAIGAQLQALRVAAANPASELLVRPDNDCKTPGSPRSKNTYIPKLHSALKLIQQCIARGEQTIVFSAFNDSLDVLSARLTEAGVAHCVADGRANQKRRGQLSAQFKLGPGRSPYQVMLAGVESMAEGHSYPMCNNVILMCYSWAYDKFEQAINHAHRINSLWNVNVYPIICDRSIDRKLEAMIQEKGDASELVLDGRLIGEQSTEVNLAELLDIARKEFNAPLPRERERVADEGRVRVEGKKPSNVGRGESPFVDEKELEKEWPALRSELSIGVRAWRHKGLALLGNGQSSSDPVTALVALELPEVESSAGISPASSTGVSPVAPDAPSRFHIPAGLPSVASERRRVLEIKGDDLNLFAGLPLFELA